MADSPTLTDIDADVMEKANDLVAFVNLESDRDCQVKGAARVIQAARNEERERCAKIASGISFEAKPGANTKNVEAITAIIKDAGLRISTAIRDGK